MPTTINSTFIHINIGEDGLTLLPQTLKKLESNAETRPLVRRLRDLIASAECIICGIFAYETPYRAWGSFFKLPWAQQSHSQATDESARVEANALMGIPSIARELERTRKSVAKEVESALTYWSPELNKNSAIKVQALAVEMVLAADRCLDCATNGRMHDAIRWSSVAYENLTEVICQVWGLLGVPPASGKFQFALKRAQ